MNIGIITQPLIANYGGILQNFALQQILKESGHNPVTFDYMSGYTGLSFLIKQSRRAVSYLLGRWPEFLYPYKEGRSNGKIIEFVGKYINTTETFWNSYSSSLIDKYDIDAIIVGSDQVWRPMYNRRLYNMFLDFSKEKDILRIAYGASFATSEWEYTDRQARKCSELLKRFDRVSVREESGIKLLERLGRSDAAVVADPTVLFGREGFDRALFGDMTSVSPQNYLGAYLLDPTEECMQALELKKKTLGLGDVVVYQLGNKEYGPLEWIDTIRKSKFFVTDSFHGTIFCLLYHVPFVTVLNEGRGADRFHSLLEPLGLENRLVHRFGDIRGVNHEIDWAVIDANMASKRAESLAYLKEICNS